MSVLDTLIGVLVLFGLLLFCFVALVATLGLAISVFAPDYDKRREADIAAIRNRGVL